MLFLCDSGNGEESQAQKDVGIVTVKSAKGEKCPSRAVGQHTTRTQDDLVKTLPTRWSITAWFIV